MDESLPASPAPAVMYGVNGEDASPVAVIDESLPAAVMDHEVGQYDCQGVDR